MPEQKIRFVIQKNVQEEPPGPYSEVLENHLWKKREPVCKSSFPVWRLHTRYHMKSSLIWKERQIRELL